MKALLRLQQLPTLWDWRGLLTTSSESMASSLQRHVQNIAYEIRDKSIFYMVWKFLTCPGIFDGGLRRIARCGKSRKDSHACGNLEKVIRSTGKLLPVKISYVHMWIRTSRRRVHLIPTNYPVLRITDWIGYMFGQGGHFFWVDTAWVIKCQFEQS